jgi:rhodanese-related sulfurtransferase/DNA-binding CsgD family transcriptional regulator
MPREFKDQLYAQFARIGHTLSSPARIEILDLLAQGEKSVEEIAAAAALGVKNTSAHLRVLRQARLVETRKESPWVYYRLAGPAVFRLLRELQLLSRERLGEVEQVARLYLERRDELEPVEPEVLWRRLSSGEVTVLDVRPEDEYRAGHIPGALSVPVGELKQRLGEIPRDRAVIAYCRGPYCVYAVDAVEILREHGFPARRLKVGVPDWQLAGRPVAVGHG